jgi:hypothetical protein
MATPAQIQANRLNAQKSTGPTSVEGKAATRFNALKHGADAQSSIIPGEDPELLAQLTSQYYEECRPQGPTETALVDAIVQSSWNMRRFARIENQLWSVLVAAQEPGDCALGAAYLADAAGPGALQKIFRRAQAAQRDWYKAHAELRRLQAERAAAPVQPHAARPEPLPAVPPIAAAPAHARPIPGQNWVGSEPPEWRL